MNSTDIISRLDLWIMGLVLFLTIVAAGATVGCFILWKWKQSVEEQYYDLLESLEDDDDDDGEDDPELRPLIPSDTPHRALK